MPLKKKRFKEGECPWYQPNAQRTDYFTFWGRMKNKYGWIAKESDFRDFDGAVYAVMESEFQKREGEWVSIIGAELNSFCVIRMSYLPFCCFVIKGDKGYARKNKNCRVAEEDTDKFDLTKFDESDIFQLQQKCALILGVFRGLRGSKEQINLKTFNFLVSKYPKGHRWAGKRCVQLSEIAHDKRNKINFNNPQVLDESDSVVFPELSDGLNGNVAQDIGGPILRMLDMLEKGKAQDKFYRRVNRGGKKFDNCVVGKDKMRAIIKCAFQKLGISNWETLRPHALRAHCISTVANSGKPMSEKQRMRATRHSSIATHASYQSTTEKSKIDHVEALVGNIEDSSTGTDEDCKIPPKTEETKSCKTKAETADFSWDLSGNDGKPITQAGAQNENKPEFSFTQDAFDSLRQECGDFRHEQSFFSRSNPAMQRTMNFVPPQQPSHNFATHRQPLQDVPFSNNCAMQPPRMPHRTPRRASSQYIYNPYIVPRPVMSRRPPPSSREIEIQRMRAEIREMRLRQERILSTYCARDEDLLYRDSLEYYAEKDGWC